MINRDYIFSKKGYYMAARVALIGNVVVLISYLLIALKMPASGLAFAFLSNVIFLYYGIKSGHRSFCYTNVILAAFSLYGVYNWVK